jgi:hypothetical protein
MVARDRIRLIDLLRKGPANAGSFYMSSRWVLVTVEMQQRAGGDFNGIARLGRPEKDSGSAPCRTAISSRLPGPPHGSLEGELARMDVPTPPGQVARGRGRR